MARTSYFRGFPIFPGVSKSQEDAPQLESTGVAKSWDTAVGDVSSVSEYFSCVSSPRKLICVGKGSGLLECGAHRPRRGQEETQDNQRWSGLLGGAQEAGIAVRRAWV